MKIIKRYVSHGKFLITEEETINMISASARTCYKSDSNGTAGAEKDLLKRIYARKHMSVFEHLHLTGRFVTSRGVTHELVRHRLALYSQESTRYCDYNKGKFGKEMMVILPVSMYDDYELYSKCPSVSITNGQRPLSIWACSTKESERKYMALRNKGVSPQVARGVLPIDLKTEIVATMNIRQWWHVFDLRRNPAAHPQMVDLMNQWWTMLNAHFPFFFDEIRNCHAIQGGKK